MKRAAGVAAFHSDGGCGGILVAAGLDAGLLALDEVEAVIQVTEISDGAVETVSDTLTEGDSIVVPLPHRNGVVQLYSAGGNGTIRW